MGVLGGGSGGKKTEWNFGSEEPGASGVVKIGVKVLEDTVIVETVKGRNRGITRGRVSGKAELAGSSHLPGVLIPSRRKAVKGRVWGRLWTRLRPREERCAFDSRNKICLVEVSERVPEDSHAAVAGSAGRGGEDVLPLWEEVFGSKKRK